MRLGIFISPHFDDVCFSMGSMVANMCFSRKILVNVFTHSDEVTNPAVLEKMKGLPDEARIAATTRMRDDEDNVFAAVLHFEKQNLGFDDADLLAGPEHENPLAHYDSMDEEIDRLTRKLHATLHEIVGQEPEVAIFCALAIGEHRNHIVAFDATVASAPSDVPLIFYEDLPYSESSANRQHRLAALRPFLVEHGYARYPIEMTPEQLARKDDLAHHYVSQMYSGNEKFAIVTPDCRQPHEALWCNAGPQVIASLFGT